MLVRSVMGVKGCSRGKVRSAGVGAVRVAGNSIGFSCLHSYILLTWLRYKSILVKIQVKTMRIFNLGRSRPKG